MTSIIPEDVRDDKEDITKPWSLKDKYRFAPEPVEGDPWKYFLDPILAKEKIRCDGWKDEVGNLLIFAGLFSAVVTAFIIESYKTLKPDPNDDIVGLLSQISNQLNSSGNRNQTSSGLQQLPSESFAPTSSAVRINIFWFLSLIFSLATVLIGIVALQWLREYQSYPGTSPKEDLAIHHMRSEGMRKWHVWKILTALPVLLQIALTLFCVGVIDFLHALRKTSVTATIAAAVGSVLLFVVATTTLPAIQVIAYQVLSLLPFPLKNPPSQCPYKSPQSRMMFASVDLLFRVRKSVILNIKILWAAALEIIKGRRPGRSRGFEVGSTTIYSLVSVLWRQSSWEHFDVAWLDVRDAICRRRYDRYVNSDSLPRKWKTKYPFRPQGQPLFDIVSFLHQALNGEQTKNSLNYLYSCFSALSLALNISGMAKESRPVFLDQNDVGPYLQDNAYLLSLCGIYAGSDQVAMFGNLDRHFTSEQISDIVALQQECNILRFLSSSLVFREFYKIHQEEILTRIRIRQFGRKSSRLYFGTLNDYFGLQTIVPLARRELALVEHPHISFIFQYIGVVEQLFSYITHPDTIISDEDLHAESGIGAFLQNCAWKFVAARNAASDRQETENILARIVSSVDHLLDIIYNSLAKMNPDKERSNHDLAFYYAAIFLQGLTKYHEDTRSYSFDQHPQADKLRRLLKERRMSITGRSGTDESELESRFLWNLMDLRTSSESPEPFSEKWWTFLNRDHESDDQIAQRVQVVDLNLSDLPSPTVEHMMLPQGQLPTDDTYQSNLHPDLPSDQGPDPTTTPIPSTVHNLHFSAAPILESESTPTNYNADFS